jgi:ankyrin repeat protein
MKRLVLITTLFALPAFGAGPESKAVKIPAPRIKSCPKLNLFKALATKEEKCLQEAIRFMDVNDVDSQEDTPLHIAILTRNKIALNFLLRHGADLNARDYQQLSPRELAEQLGHRKLADYLTGLERETERFLEAMEAGDLQAANASLLRGASVGTRNSRMDTLLHRAAQSNLPEMATLLLRYGANVNARNYLGETPLHSAALRDFREVMKVLLAAGANPSALNHRRETALDLARVREDPEIMALLKKYKARQGSRADVEFDLSGGEGQDVEASLNLKP